MPAPASLFDGVTAVRHRVRVGFEGDAIRILEISESVPLAELRAVGDRSRALFGRDGHEGWRLAFDFPLPDWIEALPRREHHGGILDRWGIPVALLVGLLVTGLLVVGLAGATGFVARLVPERWEVALAGTATGGFGGRVCTGRAGQDALDRLSARLAPGADPIRLQVVDLPVSNAATLPGRQVLLFHGLVDEARSPDEVAGVIAHEAGHVARRDPMVAIVRSLGLSLLVGGSDGGSIARALVANRYSRSAERDSDAYAIAALARARVSPAGAADFFARMRQEEGALGASRALNYLSTHPLSADREAAFRAAARGGSWRPAMTAPEWNAVRAMCKEPA